MLIFWSLVRNSVVLAVYLLFSVACFLTVHEHSVKRDIDERQKRDAENFPRGKRWMENYLPFLSHHKPLPRPFATDLRPLAITIVTR